MFYQSQMGTPPVLLWWGGNCGTPNLNSRSTQRHNITALHTGTGKGEQAVVFYLNFGGCSMN